MGAEFMYEAVLEKVQFSGSCSRWWRLKTPAGTREWAIRYANRTIGQTQYDPESRTQTAQEHKVGRRCSREVYRAFHAVGCSHRGKWPLCLRHRPKPRSN